MKGKNTSWWVIAALLLLWWAMSPGYLVYGLQLHFTDDRDDFMSLEAVSHAYVTRGNTVVVCGEAVWVREIPRPQRFHIALQMILPESNSIDDPVNVERPWDFLILSSVIAEDQEICHFVSSQSAFELRYSRFGVMPWKLLQDQTHVKETNIPLLHWGGDLVGVLMPNAVRSVVYPMHDRANDEMVVEKQHVIMYQLPTRIRLGDKRYLALLPFAFLGDALMGPIPYFISPPH